MMGHYIDIRILCDPEFSESLLMNVLFEKLHHALVKAGYNEIGVSFPFAERTPGNVIRLHGSREGLQRLMALDWAKGVADYTNVSEIRSVPDDAKYLVVKRVQPKSSLERMYRRSVRKGWLTPEEAEIKIEKGNEERLKNPYIQMNSRSSGQNYRLFIEQSDFRDVPQKGMFSTYGLSSEATIPWF